MLVQPDYSRQLPGDSGWPLIGYLPEMLKDPVAVMRERYRRYGDVSWMNMLWLRMIQLNGPDANQLVLQDKEQAFSNREGWEFFIGPFFRNGVMLRDFDDHRFHRRILQQAFKKPSLVQDLQSMQPLIARHIAGWGRHAFIGNSMLAYPAVKAMTLDIGADIFCGERLGSEKARLNAAFIDCVRAGSAWVRKPVPGNQWWRGLRSRRYLENYFTSRVAKKRQDDGDDLFGRLCRLRDDSGTHFSVRDVVDHMIFLLMAAHDTTTITLSMMLYYLARHPEWQARLRETSLAMEDELQFEDLDALEDIALALKETLRMMPPVPGMPRRTVRDITFKGHHIPEGALVNVNLSFTHRMEEYWQQPDRFDPLRFAPPRDEHKQHPYLFCPFGGGAHMCLGLHFAEMQVKAVLHHLLRRYRWKVPAGYVVPMDYSSLPKPGDDLPLMLERL